MKPNKFRNILAAILASAFMLSACAPTPTATTDAQVPTSAVTSVPASTATEATTTSESTATIEAAGTTEPALINPSLACGAGQTSATLTPALTEGPYFTSGSPERASLYEEGMAGIKLVITGYVYTADCKPVANAFLDFWQADANGVYDNSGYTLRGHQFTDANGRYQLITVVPGIIRAARNISTSRCRRRMGRS